MSGSDAIIQQALHGYHEGHRLLAASTTLPPKAEQTMAVLSDLSGHGFVRRFGEYLTGYGLPELGAYALAKTWYAPEMPRPGCVWTHTLLIPFGLLGNTQSLHKFVGLFKRPRVEEYGAYGDPCGQRLLESWEYEPRSLAGVAAKFGEIIFKLYDAPMETVIVPTESPDRVEHIFLEVWSQQWPRLRRNFNFCTGAMSGRRIDEKWFDLLGVPTSRADDVHRTIKKSVIAEIAGEPLLKEGESWFNAAIYDIEGTTKALRKFLFEFGAEAENGRRDFVPMTQLYLALDERESQSAGRVLRPLRTVFPRGNMGTKLKGRLLAGEVGGDALRTPSGVLHLILLAREELFGTTEAQLQSIAKRAWAHDPGGVIEIIDRVIEQNAPVDDTVMVTLAEALEPSQVARVGEWSRALMKLVSYRPLILAHDSLRDVEGRNLALLEYLSSPKVEREKVSVVLAQWLREGEFGQVEAASELQPSAAVPEVVNLMIAEKEQVDADFPTEWLIHLCRRFPDEVTKWLKKNICALGERPVEFKVMGCIVVGVEYRKIPVSKANVGAWERFLSNKEELDLVLREAVVMQLFLRAMQLRGAYAARVATATFPHIYRRLSHAQMSYEEWCTLQQSLIGVGWDWNRCRRLTEGLIEHFLAFEWPRKYFVEMVAKDEDLAREIQSMNFHRVRYDKFVRRSVREIPRASR